MNTIIKREQDYALRICSYLAQFPPKDSIPVSQLSEKLFISVPFATKIVHKLKKKDLVGTVQGKFGGVYLLPDSNTLSVYDVLVAMDFEFHVNSCLKIDQVCPCESTCQFHDFFAEQEALLINNFKSKKICDVTI